MKQRIKILFLILLLLAVGVGFCIYIQHSIAGTQAYKVVAEMQHQARPSREDSSASDGNDFSASDHAPRTRVPVQSKYDNLSWGIPGEADCLIDREGYSLGYIEYHEQPAWVTYKLTRSEATAKSAKRRNDFREDPSVTTGSAALEDYRHSGYDRGHLAPAADMAFSSQAMSESFFMSNMSPQKPAFNRGCWKKLEEQVRRFAVSEGEVMIVTGPILPKTKTKTIGNNKVTVPTHFYKVVMDLSPPQKMIGFILPNEGSKEDLRCFVVTIDEVETKTDLDFFSRVPQPEQERMESTVSTDVWKWMK